MARSKIKPVQSVTFPASGRISWTDKQENTLLGDLDLDRPTDKKKGQEMLNALAEEIENYNNWMAAARIFPGPLNRLPELEKVKPAVQKAYDCLRTLSFLAMKDIHQARILRKAEAGEQLLETDRLESQRIEQAIHCAHSDLALLTIFIEMAINNLSNLSKARKGRKPTPIRPLIGRINDIFNRFYKADSTDTEAFLRSTRDAFYHHVLKFAKIPKAPKHLAHLRPKQ